MEEVVSSGGVCETRGENMFQLQSSLTNCVRPLSGGRRGGRGMVRRGWKVRVYSAVLGTRSDS